MLDEKYDPEHCDNCKSQNSGCGVCQDSFKKAGGVKAKREGGLFSRSVYDPKGFTVWRYAQHNAMTKLNELAGVAQ